MLLISCAGCINLVDAGVFDGDYTNTRVFGNRFISDGAYIKLGIGCVQCSKHFATAKLTCGLLAWAH